MSWCSSCDNSAVANEGDVCTQCKEAEAQGKGEALAARADQEEADDSCERCGGEMGGMMVGDEIARRCSDCGYIDVS